MQVDKNELAEVLIKVCNVFDVVMESLGKISDPKYVKYMRDLEKQIYELKSR